MAHTIVALELQENKFLYSILIGLSLTPNFYSTWRSFLECVLWFFYIFEQTQRIIVIWLRRGVRKRAKLGSCKSCRWSGHTSSRLNSNSDRAHCGTTYHAEIQRMTKHHTARDFLSLCLPSGTARRKKFGGEQWSAQSQTEWPECLQWYLFIFHFFYFYNWTLGSERSWASLRYFCPKNHYSLPPHCCTQFLFSQKLWYLKSA